MASIKREKVCVGGGGERERVQELVREGAREREREKE